jgi:outer membrane protein
MKFKTQFILIPILCITTLLFNVIASNGQSHTQSENVKLLSLEDALTLAGAKNKWIDIDKIEELAAQAEKKDARLMALPQFEVKASYLRYSGLSVYEDGLAGRKSAPRYPTPNEASLGLEGTFNVYGGGRIKAIQEQQSVKADIAVLNVKERSGSIKLQATSYYLGLIRLYDLKRFTTDQLKRAELRLKNIRTLYKNQKVTKSDVLRAEVMLSNVQLDSASTENDIRISSQKLAVLLNLPQSVIILPKDSASMTKPSSDELEALLKTKGEGAFNILRADQSIALNQSILKQTKSYNLPTLNLFTAYGFNYPNFLFKPAVDQMYSIGFVGIKAQYSISSLYQNKNKVAAVKWRLNKAEKEKEAQLDDKYQEIESYYIKYSEALNRIEVNRKSIQQAKANYEIMSTKYFNQLALLTDLLDADNLFQGSRFNLVNSQVEAMMIYYRMLYSTGKL